MLTARHCKVVVLLHLTIGALLESFYIFWRPPIAKIAIRIVLPSLIVKAVREFVSNDHADGAKIDGVIQLLLVKRRLQNPGHEVDVVLRRKIISIHRRRSI